MEGDDDTNSIQVFGEVEWRKVVENLGEIFLMQQSGSYLENEVMCCMKHNGLSIYI